MQLDERDILARTIYGEARGEYEGLEGGIASLMAIGNVVMNRVCAQSWYGQTIAEVCQKPWQFSCWNEGDPNRVIIMQKAIRDPIFSVCQEVAAQVAQGWWPDLTKGSTHYHTQGILPAWAKGKFPRMRLGRHIFYHLTKGE